MEFLFPGFLVALGTLAVPILIHLFYFRRFRKVYFTSVRFLREIKDEQSAQRKLKHLLVLAMRLLALAALVFAFAHPFLPGTGSVTTGTAAVSVYIDNSFSMEALSEDAPLIAKARTSAREIVSAFAPNDQFQVLTNDLEGRQQYLVSRDEALVLIDDIAISPAVRPLSQIMARQKQALSGSDAEKRVAYIISDFQKSVTDIVQYEDTTLQLNFIPLQAVQEKNISIDSAWFMAPVQMAGQSAALMVQVTNHSSERAENVRLAIEYDGQEKPVGTLSIEPGASLTDTINLSVNRTGWQQAELRLTDYPVRFDDVYRFSFEVPEFIDVLVIDEGRQDKFPDAALSGAGIFRVTHQPKQAITYSSMGNYELIIVSDLVDISSGLASGLRTYVAAGGNLLLFPSPEASLESYNAFLPMLGADQMLPRVDAQSEARSINTDEFVFDDVYENNAANFRLPSTTANFRFSSGATSSAEPLISYRNGDAYLAKYPFRQGHLYVCAAPLAKQYNSLVRDAEIFVPMLYKMAISSGNDRQIAYFVGRDLDIRLPVTSGVGEPVFTLKGEGKELIPGVRTSGEYILLNLDEEVNIAGFFDLSSVSGDTTSQILALNYDRRESNLSCYTLSELTELAGPLVVMTDGMAETSLTVMIGEQSRGVPLWRFCLILALGFIATESILLRTLL
jgi:hypothetical protein